jgi:hypothetical protein
VVSVFTGHVFIESSASQNICKRPLSAQQPGWCRRLVGQRLQLLLREINNNASYNASSPCRRKGMYNPRSRLRNFQFIYKIMHGYKDSSHNPQIQSPSVKCLMFYIYLKINHKCIMYIPEGPNWRPERGSEWEPIKIILKEINSDAPKSTPSISHK